MTKEDKEDKLYSYLHFSLAEACNGKEEKTMTKKELAFNIVYVRISRTIVPEIIEVLKERKIIREINQNKFQVMEYPLINRN